MYVSVKELAEGIQRALKNVGYGAQDIQVVPAETVSPNSEASKGSRGFTTLVNVATGQSKAFTGSWGGGNMFTQTVVDDSRESLPMPESGVVIKGSMGYPRTFATIYVHPAMMGKFLPSGNEETTTDDEQRCLYCFVCIKGGEYRRDEMRRKNVSAATVDSLVERGYLKRNKAGSVQVTTAGKNAYDRKRCPY
jgi:hypothetical protein